ncbi:MAG: bifunctional hydroxymethylpyrimidine kinase/phosphomethylpyrimidine kinase [Bacteroidia bacterium]|nr:bifunctional hydroxymethylpyrimidine kinase/phosphomethylpyrimidine kinase [Bacteroidia bacterium]
MKILTIHSFAVHGTASLKAIISLLGTRVLPVPSLFLSGLTNIPGIIKTETQLPEILESTFAISRAREEKLIVYIGYLGNAGQVKLIRRLIEKNRDIIVSIVVDPVSGDHGKMYVPPTVVEAWPGLLEIADWALPNYTELTLLSGAGEKATEEEHLNAFRDKFSSLSYIITSMPHSGQLKLLLHHNGIAQPFTHKKENINFSGTGDIFAAHFIMSYFFRRQSPFQAMRMAAEATHAVIRRSMELGSEDIVLE